MKKDGWQLSELKKHLANVKDDVFQDSRTVFLSNPAKKTQIDEIISKQAYPAIVQELSGTPIRLFQIGDENPLSRIEDLKHEYTTRSLTFVLEDQNNPLKRGSTTTWYYRGEIRCSALDYWVASDFHLYLPPIIASEHIYSLLKDPAFDGNPPSLRIETSYKKNETWIIEFHSGSGAGWGITNYQQFVDQIRKEIAKALKLIDAVYRLERDFSNIMAFKVLRNLLRETYGTDTP